jgi:hypothetical protein
MSHEPSDDLDADALAALLCLPDEEAALLDELIRCADMEHARRAHGYARDNVIPPPLAVRMADPGWRAALLDVAREEDPAPHALLRALSAME